MKIKHKDAVVLENIVRSVFSCERGGMGDYIDADHFELEPFDAALIALAPLWQSDDSFRIKDFLTEWESLLRGKEEKDVDVQLYIQQFRDLVNNLMK